MEEVQILAKEYFRLWSEAGLEGLKPEPLARRFSALSQSLPQYAPEPKPTVRTLEDVRTWLGDCKRCGLCKERTNIVFGAGAAQARLMFVGEGPGVEEDAEATPFVGKAGQLLTKIIEAMGYTRDSVYIANVVKCRTPDNRAPTPDEIHACAPFLNAQIETVRPKIIVALGLAAAVRLLKTEVSMSNLRGRFQTLPDNPSILVMPTYHPAYLIRSPNAKRLVWDDMKFVKSKLESIQ